MALVHVADGELRARANDNLRRTRDFESQVGSETADWSFSRVWGQGVLPDLCAKLEIGCAWYRKIYGKRHSSRKKERVGVECERVLMFGDPIQLKLGTRTNGECMAEPHLQIERLEVFSHANAEVVPSGTDIGVRSE